MALVATVTPTTFEKVHYEADAIAALFADIAATVPGLPDDLAIDVQVDEETQTTRVAVASVDPVVITIQSGALENTKQPRTFGPTRASEAIGRLLFELADRLDDGFGAPEAPEPSDLALRVAWDAYCYGRTARAGHRTFKPKHIYNFRNRHGFTDAADATFEKLWSAENLTWDEIVDLVS